MTTFDRQASPDPWMPQDKPLTPTEQRTLEWLMRCGEHYSATIEGDRGRFVWVPHEEVAYSGADALAVIRAAVEGQGIPDERLDEYHALVAQSTPQRLLSARCNELTAEVAWLRSLADTLTTVEAQT